MQVCSTEGTACHIPKLHPWLERSPSGTKLAKQNAGLSDMLANRPMERWTSGHEGCWSSKCVQAACHRPTGLLG